MLKTVIMGDSLFSGGLTCKVWLDVGSQYLPKILVWGK